MAFTLVDLFERMATAGASDLHLCAGSPPVLRVRGELERLDLPELTADEMRGLLSIELLPLAATDTRADNC